ncbi:MAG: aminopeptidase [Burkholderiaceae bacterium]
MKMNWRILVVCGSATLMAGCAQMGYYMQAAQGEFNVLSEAKPIDELIADPAVGDNIKSKLGKLKEIRAFAAQQLGLPDNGSFKTYADLKRPFVLWNVVATPELSLKTKQWCFPIAGCVDYRGYYSKQDAQEYAAVLRRENYDVQVAGVPAYSTLGWFNDPVLSTYIHYPEGELARLIFHELAHQVVYAPGDTQFNESFATAVEEAGVERWLVTHGDEKTRESYVAYEGRKHDFIALLMRYRKKLEANYSRVASDDEKKKQKAVIFQELQSDYQVLKTSWGGYAGYDRWFAEPLSNAHLASVATYHDYVPGFRALLTQEKSFGKFYDAVRTLASLDKSARHQQLAALTQANPVVATSITSASN